MNRKQFLSALIIAPIAACFKKTEAKPFEPVTIKGSDLYLPLRKLDLGNWYYTSTFNPPEYGQMTVEIDGVKYCYPTSSFNETYETT